jgi:hypothetical protein
VIPNFTAFVLGRAIQLPTAETAGMLPAMYHPTKWHIRGITLVTAHGDNTRKQFKKDDFLSTEL